jgi:hypothetical protein
MVREIKILDTGSTDKSVERASIYGDVVKLETSDLGLARMEIEKHCTKDWVLVLDWDEKIQDWKPIRRLIQDRDVDAFRLTLLNVFPDGQQFPQTNVRLYRKGCGLWVGSIHEHFEVNPDKTEDRVEAPVIIHHATRPTEQYNDLYAARIRKEVEANPENGFARFQYGLCQLKRGQEVEAEKSFNRALKAGYRGALQAIGMLKLRQAQTIFARMAQELPPDDYQGAFAQALLTKLAEINRMVEV